MESLTGKLRTAQPDTADVPEKTKRSRTPSQLSPQKTCEGSVETKRIPSEPNASSKDDPTPCKGERSAHSEILNADSPRTSNVSGALLPLDNINTYSHIPAEMVDSSIIHMSDNLCDQMLSPQACQRISVKLEEGSLQDDSCNYTLTQLDEERGLPWWDWP